ncbi:MAG: DUF6505 family protein [Pseudomonadota bacterium]
MSRLARVIRLDESDENVFTVAAEAGEWAISGAFEFSNWTEDDLTGKQRQAFANGWLGLESFGRATLVAVADITEPERAALTKTLAAHFVARYGAPSAAAAEPVAADEIAHMVSLCEDHEANTLLVVERTLEAVGVREKLRAVKPRSASLDAFAVHGS